MEKVLYLTLQPFIENDGVTKKTIAQRNAIIGLGYDVDIVCLKGIDDEYALFMNDTMVKAKAYSGNMFEDIWSIVDKKNYKFLFIRYVACATYAFIHFLSKARNKGVYIVAEVPTYPYDGELNLSFSKQGYRILRERFFRRYLYKYVKFIVTTSQFDSIFGIPTINISNAPSSIPPLSKRNKDKGYLKLVTVANIAFWHGYDRIIAGISNYYKGNPSLRVELFIVGSGNLEILESLKQQVLDDGLDEYVHFLGPKDGTDLDEVFCDADFAIGCLGCHRKKIIEVKSLKNVEYAMRGLQFAYSENNSDFDEREYVLKFKPDDSSIDIHSIVEFISHCKCSAEEIRLSVNNMTWDYQMQKVFSYLPR